jgi:uncharacterized protein YdaU (DUF1376 family)
MDWYNHYLGDYIRDTAELSVTEHGAYRLLLDHYYSTETPLPLSTTKLNRILRAENRTEKAAILHIINKYFTKTESGYINKKCEETIAKYKKRRDINRNNASHSHSDSLSEPVRNPLTTNHYPLTKDKELCQPGLGYLKKTKDDLIISEKIYELMRVKQPTRRKPNMNTWGMEIAYLRQVENKTLDSIFELFEWAHSDSFWMGVVTSPKALNKHWDALELSKLSGSNAVKAEKSYVPRETDHKGLDKLAVTLGINTRSCANYAELRAKIIDNYAKTETKI